MILYPNYSDYSDNGKLITLNVVFKALIFFVFLTLLIFNISWFNIWFKLVHCFLFFLLWFIIVLKGFFDISAKLISLL